MLNIVRREPGYGWGLLNLKDEMNRMFRNFFEEYDQRGSLWAPSVDIVEENDRLELTAEIPGVDKKDVKISVQDNVLTIEGQKKQEYEEKNDSYYCCERSFGRFSRSFTIPSNVDSEKIKADYKDGILTLTLPKVEEAKPRQIEIK